MNEARSLIGKRFSSPDGKSFVEVIGAELHERTVMLVLGIGEEDAEFISLSNFKRRLAK